MRRVIGTAIILTLLACATQEMKKVRQMEIQNVDIGGIPDGDYPGAFSYGGFDYRIKTNIKGHRIVDVQVLQNRDTKYAKRAEGVIPRIIERQTPNVDAVTGATTTSKALMKAVEDSLVSRASR